MYNAELRVHAIMFARHTLDQSDREAGLIYYMGCHYWEIAANEAMIIHDMYKMYTSDRARTKGTAQKHKTRFGDCRRHSVIY
jgi:hypothetical protein